MKKWTAPVALFLLANCGGATNAITYDTTPTPATSIASTTTLPPLSTTTRPLVTTAAPSPTIAEPTTTVEAATTAPIPMAPDSPPVPASPQDEVRAAIENFGLKYDECLVAPAACDPATFASGGYLAEMYRLLADYAASGFFAGPGTEPGYDQVEDVRIDGDRASAEVCVWDTAILYGPPPGAGQPPAVMNDLQGTYHATYTLVRSGGRWSTTSIKFNSEEMGRNSCAG